jgi:hypothetical protein
MIANLRTVLLATSLGFCLSGATLTVNSTGLGFVDNGSGFQPSELSVNLRVGLTAGQIDPGVYRAAFEFDIQSIDGLATINSASLLIWPLAPAEQQGRVMLSAYFGDGVIQASDVAWTLETLELEPSGLGVTTYDITSTFRSFFNIGAPFLGFSARQDPLGVCAVPFFGSCSTILFGDSSVTPTLVINYTPFTPPVPEPVTWALMVTGGAVLGFVRCWTTRR